MTGCVPVWLGPSYATMPFADMVDYKKSALFFNVSQHRWAAIEISFNLLPIYHCVHNNEADFSWAWNTILS